MGICESAHHGKNLDKNDTKKESPEINQNEQTLEYQNLKIEESGVRPSIFNQTDNKNSSDPEAKEDNEKPELVQYDRDNSYCNNNNKTKTSMFSSGRSEEEIIIRGEINKEARNKDEDFANNSFKKLVKNKGGIIIKNEELNSNYCESHKTNSIFDLGKENISEIHSKQAASINNNNINTLKVNNSDVLRSSINYDKNKLVNNGQNLDYKGIISGKYDINGKLIPNGNFHVDYNDNINGKYDNNNNILGINNNILRESNRINISIHESCPRIDSFLHLPKTDQPPPEMDELSGSILRNSLISG